MSNVYGVKIKVMIFGQSHSPAVGVTIEGVPSGFVIDFNELNSFLRRRAPGLNEYSTARTEPDEPEFVSGLFNKITCGAPITAIIKNKDANPKDYDAIKDTPRPSHADYAAYMKYGESRDFRGGGQFTGRLTAPLCVAGGIFLQLLREKGIKIAAHALRIGNIFDRPFENDFEKDFEILNNAEFPTLDACAGNKMTDAINEIKKAGDSLGGVVECAVIGLPPGIGEPMFGGMENKMSAAVFAIPAVKGIEFGNGFACSGLTGSENNDAFVITDGKIKTSTNNHGGILGGLTSGMPLIFRAAIKPTPSIPREQKTVNLKLMEETRILITGRYDPCIVPRAVPCVEAAAAIAVYDALS